MPLLLCCALVGSTAEAQGGGVVLEWSPASECASRAALVAEVERLLGRTLSEAPPTQVSAVVLRHDPDLRLELRMEREGHASSRTLDGPSCEALVRAAALIIAVAIDPEAVADNDPELDSELDPPSEPEPRDPPAATQLAESTEHEPHEARAAAPAALSDVRFIGALAPGLAIGPLPDPAAALTVSIGIGAGAFELTLAGLVTPEQAARLEGSDAAGRLGLALGRLRGCVSFEPAGDQLELLPCLAVEAGAMWGRGENVPVVRSGAAPWVAGAAGLEARFWIADALALGLSAELVVPFVPVRFILTLEGAAEELHRAADAGALIGLTVTLRIR